jgi:hypothetical protein
MTKLAEAAVGVPVAHGASKSDDARNQLEVMPPPGRPKKQRRSDPVFNLLIFLVGFNLLGVAGPLGVASVDGPGGAVGLSGKAPRHNDMVQPLG